MKKKLYIHIGTGKTGTTALQWFLYNNSKILEDKYGIKYANTLIQDMNHHLLCTNYLRVTSSLDEKEILNVIERNLEELIEESSDSIIDKFVISSEYFPGLTEDDIKNLYFKKLSRHFDVKIIVYFRRQDELLESWYSQIIKADILKEINTNIESLQEQLERAKVFDYYYHVDKWRKYIGFNNIIVRIYERNQFYKGSIFNDFLKIFDVENIDNFSFPPKDPNPRLSREQILLIRSFVNAGLTKYIDNTIKMPFNIPSVNSKYFLSPIKRTQLVKKYEDINARVARDFLKRGDGKLFYEPLPLEKDESWNPIEEPPTEYVLKAVTHLIEKCKSQQENSINELKNEILALSNLIKNK